MDFEVQRCTRHCAETGRELAEGETFYSVLVSEGSDVRRYDYAVEAWQGPPEKKVVGWWKSQMPTREAKRARMAPSDVLLDYFKQLLDDNENADLRYVLALLLVRHRVMRQEETAQEQDSGETLVLYCPRNEETYRVAVAPPDEDRVAAIQQHLTELFDAPTN